MTHTTPSAVFCVLQLSFSCLALAEETEWFTSKGAGAYQIRFTLSGVLPEDNQELRTLLERHLTIYEVMQNAQLNLPEWRRTVKKTPQEISELLATAGYFKVQSATYYASPQSAVFHLTITPRAHIQNVELHFQGDILQPAYAQIVQQSTEAWSLPVNSVFTQQAWSNAKRSLLGKLLDIEFPNARIAESQALVDPLTQQVNIKILMDSGPAVCFGTLKMHGMQHYDEKLFAPMTPFKTGQLFRQADLLKLQSNLMNTGKFNQVDVVANTEELTADHLADIDVTLKEQDLRYMRVGAGASTNTGARVVLNYTDRNLLDRGLMSDNSLRIEQRLQSATSNITFLTDDQGNRDSIQNSITRTAISGQVTTALQNGVRRYWGQPKKFEQFVGANLLYEFQEIAGAPSQFNKAATVTYGLDLRQLDHDMVPTKGWILNTQFQLSPFDHLSDGRFLQSQVRVQGFYPLTESTQWLGRISIATLTGSGRVPATYRFRAGGDQSVRGYAYQSLGVKEADAVVGGRFMLTGSSEVVQWLTPSWGAAMFVDFGNASNSWKDYQPAYGYGMGVRWRSPIGPVGVDVAYGEQTGKYRLHFNLGVNF